MGIFWASLAGIATIVGGIGTAVGIYLGSRAITLHRIFPGRSFSELSGAEKDRVWGTTCVALVLIGITVGAGILLGQELYV